MESKREVVWFYTFTDEAGGVTGERYIRAGEPFISSYGSGVVGVFDLHKNHRERFIKYPIYSALVIRDSEHDTALEWLIAAVKKAVTEQLSNGDVTETVLDRICWVLNLLLHRDDREPTTREVITMAINYFCSDYRELPPGTLMRQPINYIFDTVGVDGIWSKIGNCISYIPTDFKGVEYSTV